MIITFPPLAAWETACCLTLLYRKPFRAPMGTNPGGSFRLVSARTRVFQTLYIYCVRRPKVFYAWSAYHGRDSLASTSTCLHGSGFWKHYNWLSTSNLFFQLYNAIFTAHGFLRGRQSTSSFLLVHLTNGHLQFMVGYEHGIFFFLNTGHGTTSTAGFGSRGGSDVYAPISAFGSPLLRCH